MPSPLEIAAANFKNRESEVRKRRFPVPSQSISIRRKKAVLVRHDAKMLAGLIKPANADKILDALPVEEGDRLHAITAGDFVFFDLVSRLVDRLGAPESMTLATLSVSVANLEEMERMMTMYPTFPVHLILSDYFKAMNKEIFGALDRFLTTRFPHRFRLTLGRSHAKITLIDFGQAGCFVIESSANLRSSRNIEHIAIFRDRELANFHAAWIEDLHADYLSQP